MSEKAINLTITGNGEIAKNSDDSNIYKDYIITNNRELQQANKDAALEVAELQQRIEELEEDNDNYDRRFRNVKMHLANFHSANQVYKQIVDDTQEFADKENKSNQEYFLIQQAHKPSNSFSFATNANKLLLAYIFNFVLSYVMGANYLVLFATIAILAIYLIYIRTSESTNENNDQLRHQYAEKIKHIIAIKQNRDNDLKELQQTLDVIHEFMDNL